MSLTLDDIDEHKAWLRLVVDDVELEAKMVNQFVRTFTEETNDKKRLE